MKAGWRIRYILFTVFGTLLVGLPVGYLILVKDVPMADRAEQAQAPAAAPLDFVVKKPTEQEAPMSIDHGRTSATVEQAPPPQTGLTEDWEYLFNEIVSMGASLNWQDPMSQNNLYALRHLVALLPADIDDLQMGLLTEEMNAHWPSETTPALPELFQKLYRLQAGKKAIYQQLEAGELSFEQISEASHALETLRNEHLGPELAAKFYPSDAAAFSPDLETESYKAGVPSAFYTTDLPPQEQRLISDNMGVLARYRAGDLSREQARSSLREQLDAGATDQVMETEANAHEWAQKSESFLAQYQTVVNAGLQGADERQMRAEMIEQHFSEEERAFAELYLFGEAAVGATSDK